MPAEWGGLTIFTVRGFTTGEFNRNGLPINLYNDNNMAQLRFEHFLNDNWTMRGGFQWLDGTLQGNAVEANGVATDGRTLGRNHLVDEPASIRSPWPRLPNEQCAN